MKVLNTKRTVLESKVHNLNGVIVTNLGKEIGIITHLQLGNPNRNGDIFILEEKNKLPIRGKLNFHF